ncbi:hypothetical protein [Clostridium formicaceticum]|uniref:Uncharacterized protein n=1 Tax=Clostridium formicaceticum TaxID=1497 RepID=A0AAC9WH89_9CLOT|nr:hypothetical protein [Clostridium formicaceticum]ARE88708.1 hypothetical protein CLFO_31140 [Clostridium formicaceticum]
MWNAKIIDTDKVLCYSCLYRSAELLISLHNKIIAVKQDKWLGDRAKEKLILRGKGVG